MDSQSISWSSKSNKHPAPKINSLISHIHKQSRWFQLLPFIIKRNKKSAGTGAGKEADAARRLIYRYRLLPGFVDHQVMPDAYDVSLCIVFQKLWARSWKKRRTEGPRWMSHLPRALNFFKVKLHCVEFLMIRVTFLQNHWDRKFIFLLNALMNRAGISQRWLIIIFNLKTGNFKRLPFYHRAVESSPLDCMRE